MPHFRRSSLAIIALILAALCWSGNFVAGRALRGQIDPLTEGAGFLNTQGAVELARAVPRMPQPRWYRPPTTLEPALAVPLVALNPFEASAPDKVLVAAMSHLRKSRLRQA